MILMLQKLEVFLHVQRVLGQLHKGFCQVHHDGLEHPQRGHGGGKSTQPDTSCRQLEDHDEDGGVVGAPAGKIEAHAVEESEPFPVFEIQAVQLLYGVLAVTGHHVPHVGGTHLLGVVRQVEHAGNVAFPAPEGVHLLHDLHPQAAAEIVHHQGNDHPRHHEDTHPDVDGKQERRDGGGGNDAVDNIPEGADDGNGAVIRLPHGPDELIVKIGVVVAGQIHFLRLAVELSVHTVAELILQNRVQDETVDMVGHKNHEIEQGQGEDEHRDVHKPIRGIQSVEHSVAEVDRRRIDSRPHERPQGEENDIRRKQPPDLGQNFSVVDQDGTGAAAGLADLGNSIHALTSSRVSASVAR